MSADASVPRTHFAYRNAGERVILKNTPLGRAPQVKRENRDEDLDVGELLFEDGSGPGSHAKRSHSLPGALAISPPTSPESTGNLSGTPPARSDGNGGDYVMGAAVDIKFRPPRKAPVGGKWSEEEDARLREIVETFGAKNWKRLAMLLGNVRSDVQCLHRWNKVLRPGLSKGPWTADEDTIVRDMVLRHGAGNIKWSVTVLESIMGKDGRPGISSNSSVSLKSNWLSMILEPLILKASRVLDD